MSGHPRRIGILVIQQSSVCHKKGGVREDVVFSATPLGPSPPTLVACRARTLLGSRCLGTNPFSHEEASVFKGIQWLNQDTFNPFF